MHGRACGLKISQTCYKRTFFAPYSPPRVGLQYLCTRIHTHLKPCRPPPQKKQQAPYLEAVEVAPPKWRGAFGYSIQLGRSIGLFCRGLLMQGIAGQVGVWLFLCVSLLVSLLAAKATTSSWLWFAINSMPCLAGTKTHRASTSCRRLSHHLLYVFVACCTCPHAASPQPQAQPTSPKWGWRLAVLFPIWPAMVIMMLVPLLPETPNR